MGRPLSARNRETANEEPNKIIIFLFLRSAVNVLPNTLPCWLGVFESDSLFRVASGLKRSCEETEERRPGFTVPFNGYSLFQRVKQAKRPSFLAAYQCLIEGFESHRDESNILVNGFITIRVAADRHARTVAVREKCNKNGYKKTAWFVQFSIAFYPSVC